MVFVKLTSKCAIRLIYLFESNLKRRSVLGTGGYNGDLWRSQQYLWQFSTLVWPWGRMAHRSSLANILLHCTKLRNLLAPRSQTPTSAVSFSCLYNCTVRNQRVLVASTCFSQGQTGNPKAPLAKMFKPALLSSSPRASSLSHSLTPNPLSPLSLSFSPSLPPSSIHPLLPLSDHFLSTYTLHSTLSWRPSVSAAVILGQLGKVTETTNNKIQEGSKGNFKDLAQISSPKLYYQ